nr:hypothetical protein [Tanacetum cinerariifolium]
MAFDLRQTEDGLPWPDSANMEFDLWQTEDVLPWPGNANMAFDDLRQTEDGLPWPDNANMAFDELAEIFELILQLSPEYAFSCVISGLEKKFQCRHDPDTIEFAK